ncbi:MAG: T9SS type A sorting domain-containing protein [Saprospiraceae bacterium]|nr:T9SS type A sorting domain-containing protein [Saprospiraceae bacterium]
MKTFHFIAFLVSFFYIQCDKLMSQTPNWIWAKSIGGSGNELGNFIAIDKAGDGSVYVVGPYQNTVDFDPGDGVSSLVSAGYYDFFILKLDKDGNFIWVKGIGGNLGSDVARSIVIDPSGNGDLFITGDFIGTVDFDPGMGISNLSSAGSNDNFVLKLDKDGNFLWVRAIRGTSNAGSNFITIDPAGSGDLYICGLFAGTVDFDPGAGVVQQISNGSFDLFILKLNRTGDFVWVKTAGGSNFDVAYQIAMDTINGGHVYITGRFRLAVDFDPGPGTHVITALGVDDIFILKLDQNGQFIWAKDLGGPGFGEGNALVIDQQVDGGLYLAGRIGGGSVDLDPGTGVHNVTAVGTTDMVICKFDKDGNFKWAKQMGGAGSETNANSISKHGAYLYISGFFANTIYFDNNNALQLKSAGSSDVFILKLEDSGNFNWVKEMGGSEYDIGLSMALDAEGKIHITGDYFSRSIICGNDELVNKDSTFNTVDVFIAKLDNIITSLDQDQYKHKISVYPNPFTDQLQIQFSEIPLDILQVDILNIYKEVVYLKKNFTESLELNLETNLLVPGIYFVRIQSKHFQEVIKIVKL